MKSTLIFTGKTSNKNIREEINEYLSRLKHYTEINLVEIPGISSSGSMNESVIREKEALLILTKLKDADFLVLLDERGKEMNSVEFSATISKWQNRSIKNIVYVVGGAYGFSEKLYQRAGFKLSLSKMTFSHQMVRLIFLEQLYRAYTIIKGEPYHHA